MRIGIDGRELTGNATGVGRYLEGLLREWAVGDGATDCEFVLYAATSPARLPHSPRLSVRVMPGTGGTWWEQLTLPAGLAGDRLDVFFSPGYTAPLRLRMPSVVAIHDISFVVHPEWFTMREGVRRRWLTRHAARRARRVLTISQFTQGELVRHLGVPHERIAVIPPGVAASTAVGRRRSGGVLYVGSIFNRRRLPDLIRGFARLARSAPALTLDIVGDNRSHPHEDLEALIRREGLHGQARWRSYVSDETLQELYATSRAFAFLSEYEGLGLTPLEALAAGVPPVLLDTPVARETCGDAALYVAAGDIDGLARALASLVNDTPVRAQLLARAPAVLARYDWRAAARDTLAVLRNAAGQARS